MHHLNVFVMILLMGGAALAGQPRKYDVDAAQSRIAFAVPFMGLTDVEGQFTDYSATLLADPDDPLTLSASLVIRTESVFTANRARDRHLRSGDFFDVERFPVIRFRSSGVEHPGDGDVLHLVGDLTIRDVTRTVRIPFHQVHGEMADMWGNTRVGYRGSLRIARADYGMAIPANWNRPLDLDRLTIGDSVRIDLEIQGSIRNVWKMGFGGTGDPDKANLAALMFDAWESGGIDAALQRHDSALANDPDGHAVTEWGLTILGYRLLQREHYADAAAVFELAVTHFPESANAWDSLGEVAWRRGDRAAAVRHYRHALDLNPHSTSAAEMLRLLGEAAPDKGP